MLQCCAQNSCIHEMCHLPCKQLFRINSTSGSYEYGVHVQYRMRENFCGIRFLPSPATCMFALWKYSVKQIFTNAVKVALCSMQ